MICCLLNEADVLKVVHPQLEDLNLTSVMRFAGKAKELFWESLYRTAHLRSLTTCTIFLSSRFERCLLLETSLTRNLAHLELLGSIQDPIGFCKSIRYSQSITTLKLNMGKENQAAILLMQLECEMQNLCIPLPSGSPKAITCLARKLVSNEIQLVCIDLLIQKSSKGDLAYLKPVIGGLLKARDLECVMRADTMLSTILVDSLTPPFLKQIEYVSSLFEKKQWM